MIAGILASLAVLFSDWHEAATYLSGAGSAEEMTLEAVEKFEHLYVHKINLNTVSLRTLLSSGLFSEYQAASLADYRRRTGEVMSWTELSLVDAFNPTFVEALKYFAVIRTASPPGLRPSRAVRSSLMLRSGLRTTDPTVAADYSYALKYSLDAWEHLGAYWSFYKSPGDISSFPGTFSLSYRTPSATLIFGDYQARFAQGLLFWSGFSFSGFSGPGSFGRSSRGVSATSSFSGGCRGAALELSFEKWVLDAAISIEGLRERMNGTPEPLSPVAVFSVSRYFRTGHFGFTSVCSGNTLATGIDGRWGNRDFSFFAELVAQLPFATPSLFSPAAIAGVLWIPSYGNEFSALVRCYPSSYMLDWSNAARTSSKTSDEMGFSAYWKDKCNLFSFDSCLHPSKNNRQYKIIGVRTEVFELSDSIGVHLKPVSRISCRYKPGENYPLRFGARLDMCLTISDLCANLRLNYLKCISNAFLSYFECGYSSDSFKSFLRGTLFSVDNWDDRIYAYERDLPGCFTCPAFYGRGFEISFYSSISTGLHQLSLRLSALSYPYSSKHGKLEARIQYLLKL